MKWPFSLFKRRDPRQNHITDQEDSESGAATMATKGELNRLKYQLQMEKAKLEHARDMLKIQADIKEAQLDLQDLDEESGEDEPAGDSSDDMLVKLLSGVIAGKNAGSQIMPPPAAENIPDGEPSNQQLREMWAKLPPQYKDQAMSMVKK